MLEINIHRGDYLKKKLNIYDSTSEYASIDFDEIYFTVKKSAYNTDYLFQKTLTGGGITKDTDGIYIIEINSEDTDNLSFGDYVFDIELIENSTPIKQTCLGILHILEEVTYVSNEGDANNE